jgi:hypothetical protein
LSHLIPKFPIKKRLRLYFSFECARLCREPATLKITKVLLKTGGLVEQQVFKKQLSLKKFLKGLKQIIVLSHSILAKITVELKFRCYYQRLNFRHDQNGLVKSQSFVIRLLMNLINLIN